jgi:predicted PurR-regulated permease PerM
MMVPMRQIALRTFVVTIVAGGTVVLALALWKIKLVVALIFLAFIVAAAMRPGVEALRRHRIPRGIGILIHYAVLFGLIALFLWLVVPRALDQVQAAIGQVPSTRTELRQQAAESTGIRHEILNGIQKRLKELPTASELVTPALSITIAAFEVVIGIFFVLASAAYWIFERDRAETLVCSLLPPQRARLVRDTWELIDLKLGAYVRGQALLIVFVATVLSGIFWAIGLPYWLLVGAFAGVVELVPVIGPLTAGAVAVGVGLTDSWQLALAAGIAVLAVRLLEDYIVIPRVLGEAVGLSPLLVLIAVSACGILFGGFAVLLAIPIAAVVATLLDVIVLNKNPADQEVPTVLFPAKDAEG